jgi:hypothetical protein
MSKAKMDSRIWRGTDRAARLRFLDQPPNARKLRLFSCACCFRMGRWLDERGRAAVELAERYADGRVGEAALRKATHRAEVATREALASHGALLTRARNSISTDERAARASSQAAAHAAQAVSACLSGAWNETAEHAALAVACVVPRSAYGSQGWATAFLASARQERRVQKALLDDLFGDPFRPVTLDLSCLAGGGEMVRKVARAIYEERTFDHLPVLADALEEAGCTQGDILSHLCGPGFHARGCWGLDLALGRR